MDAPMLKIAVILLVFVGGMYAYERWKDWVSYTTYQRVWTCLWTSFVVLYVVAAIYHFLKTGQIMVPAGVDYPG